MPPRAFLAVIATLAACSAPMRTPVVATTAAPTSTPSVLDDSALASMGARLEREFGPARVPVRTIGILLYDGYTTLDAMGPHQVLSELPGVTIKLIAKARGPVRNMTGLTVIADHAISEVDSLDLLVVPGGFGGTYRAAHDTAITNWVRRVHPTTRFTTSVCTGAWILGGAGLLTGLPATTHWWGREILERDYGATYHPERWVRSGKIWTSAGVTAGMDMSLALVREIRGERYAQAAMLDLEYDPAPPVRGGSERNTDPALVAYIRRMYDAGLAPVQAELRAPR
ncbi:MAG: DJ-1/PfpI family protein [Gemmatimonadaceae bacterium]|nr:DJ-1/PfpI family protein [Gemmatimonadaceae bacterium]